MTAPLHRILESLRPARALDLACGRGEQARYLAALGWQVTAVDRDAQAVQALSQDATIDARVMDLEREPIAPLGAFELILAWRYFQRDLFDPVRTQLTPGGVFATATKTTGRFAAGLSSLESEFPGWERLCHQELNGFAVLIVRKPAVSVRVK